MRDPIPAVRRNLRRELDRLRKLNDRLRRCVEHLTARAARGGSFARQARTLATVLQCILRDQLVPAAEALEREIESQVPLPEDGDLDGEEGEP